MAASWMVSRAFTRQFSSTANVGGHSANAGEMANMWRKIFLFIGLPAIGLGMLNGYLKTKEEEEHFVRPEFVPYEYLRIRTKRYPWGDGTRTLFHNPHVNALPNGYEESH